MRIYTVVIRGRDFDGKEVERTIDQHTNVRATAERQVAGRARRDWHWRSVDYVKATYKGSGK